jgi:EAL domain-containing protein (putative c-di-GMP-specific phosphodiesterase class I)
VLRVDFVKVDGSVVRKLLSSDHARGKLNAIVRVAQVLGAGVVAECVEDQDILAQLKAMQVTHAQGFGVHKPAPIALVT